jgi:hypothetical protein
MNTKLPDLSKLVTDLSRALTPMQLPWLIKKNAEVWTSLMTWWKTK